MKRLGESEKGKAALSSVAASGSLTILKIVAAVLTGSLGILSEAAHSALDLVAALTTYFAIKVSSRPPDPEHLYGHGKVENFSGLVETLLLLVTCAWIIYEATQRLVLRGVPVEPGYVGFGVMIFSVIVDISRSRMLYRVSRKHESQALEADALHFRTDILTSAAVIAGLAFVRLGFIVADPLAALGVSFFVIIASLRLGKKTVDALLDRAPTGLVRRIENELKGIQDAIRYDNLRVRRSGPQTFVDMRVFIPRTTTLQKAHSIASEVEKRVRRIVPQADVMVHTEAEEFNEDIADKVRLVVADMPSIRSVHSTEVSMIGQHLWINLHIEVKAGMRLEEAHKVAEAFELKLEEALGGAATVTTHIESEKGNIQNADRSDRILPTLISEIRETVLRVSEVKKCHDISVIRLEGGLSISLSCEIPGTLTIEEAHKIAEEVENQVRNRIGNVNRVSVHTEPYSDPLA